MRLLARFRLQESKKDSINIWLPGYFCNESLEPLKKEEVNIFFYPILKDGSPDIQTCKQLIRFHNTPDLFFAVHFFGREMNFSASADFAKSFDAWFVEDAAHVLKRSENIGKYSHFIFYSPHKLIPIADGSIVVLNKENFKEDFKHLSEKFKTLYQNLIKEDKKINFHSIIWLIKRTLQKLGYRKRVNYSLDIFEEEVRGDSSILDSKISTLSKRLLSLENNLEAEIDIRVRNYNFWRKFFTDNNFSGEEIFSENNFVCPYLFGIKLKDKKQILKALDLLNLYSIPVSSWPDIPQEIYKDKNLFKYVIELKSHTLFLPVHSSLGFS